MANIITSHPILYLSMLQTRYSNDGDFLILFAIIITVFALFLVYRIMAWNEKRKQKELWQTLRELYEPQIRAFRICFKERNYTGALKIYETLQSGGDATSFRKFQKGLANEIQILRFNMKILDHFSMLQAHLQNNQIPFAVKEIEDIFHKITAPSPSLFDNPVLLEKLQGMRTQLSAQKESQKQIFLNEIEKISQTIKNGQLNLADKKFKEVLSQLKEWSFPNIMQEALNRQKTFLNFRKTFDVTEKSEMKPYLDDLDEEFQHWSSNESHHVGKKV